MVASNAAMPSVTSAQSKRIGLLALAAVCVSQKNISIALIKSIGSVVTQVAGLAPGST